jgi:predicted molibdopterin-dependent oxidoreductase YjgC
MATLIRNDLKRIYLSINGKEVPARAGQTILDVARETGVEIPTLCYLERLKPIGACRLCIVEVAGTTTPVTACTAPVAQGMQVRTDTPFLENMRREALKLILLHHPMNCEACEITGACRLQDMVYAHDITHQDLHTYNIRPIEFAPAAWATPLIRYHPRRCVLCGRCVQACVELSDVGAINYRGRGAYTRIAPVEPTAEFKPECVSCGECMSVCPVNALTEANGRPKGKTWERTKVKTICAYCGVGCQLELNVNDGQVVGISTSAGGVNRGALCTKGRFGYDFIGHKDRLKQPMIKKSGYWEEVNWDEALDYVAERLIDVREKHGADAIGGLASARATNEDNYLFQKFLRGVMGTNNVDHCARL